MAVMGLTIGIGANTKEFNKEMKKMDKTVRQTKGEVYNLSKSLELKWDASKFARAQKLAQEALEQTNVKAKSLKDRLKHLEETGVDKTSEQYQKVQRELSKTELSAQRLETQLQKVKDLRIEDLAKKFEKVGQSITSVGQAMLPFSATAGAILAGFAKIGSSAIKAGDEIGTTAQQLNISTKAFQQWQYIAQQTDVDAGTMTKGIMKIQQALGSLSAGEIDATSDALRGLGFTQEQATGGMSENFEAIIGELAGMEDATMQAYYANELFGARMGAQLIPLLNDGGDGLARLTAEFESLNYMTDEEVQAMDAFEDVMDKIKYQFTTMKNQIGVALLPLMQMLADVIQNKVIPPMQKLADWFSSLSNETKTMALGILTFITVLAPMLLIMGKLTSGLGGVIRSLKGVRVALTLLSAHPIILVIGVLIGLMFLLYKKNEEFRESVNGLFAQLKDALMPILQILGVLFTDIFKAIMPLVNILMNLLAPALTFVVKIISFLVKILSAVLVPYLKFVGKVWGEIFGFIPKIIEGVVASVEWMVNSVIGLINDLIDKVNKVGKYVGITIGKLDEVEIGIATPSWETPSTADSEFEGELLTPDSVELTRGVIAQDALATPTTMPITGGVTTNIDHSQKDIEINITIENYATELDIDDAIEQINIKLAEAM